MVLHCLSASAEFLVFKSIITWDCLALAEVYAVLFMLLAARPN